jgi:hypothetical protein
VLIAGLAVLYRVAPSRKDARWQWLSWDWVAATGLLLVGPMLCSPYASYAPAQNKTYGELELQTRRDTTVGPAQPMGSAAPTWPTTWPGRQATPCDSAATLRDGRRVD